MTRRVKESFPHSLKKNYLVLLRLSEIAANCPSANNSCTKKPKKQMVQFTHGLTLNKLAVSKLAGRRKSTKSTSVSQWVFGVVKINNNCVIDS